VTFGSPDNVPGFGTCRQNRSNEIIRKAPIPRSLQVVGSKIYLPHRRLILSHLKVKKKYFKFLTTWKGFKKVK